MLMKLLGICCALAATGTVLVYGFGLQVQRPIAPLQAKQEPPHTTPKVPAVVASAPVHAPAAEEVTEATEIVEDDTTYPELAASVQPIREDPPAAPEITVSAEPAVVEVVPPAATVEQVFVFWQPFRSRGSAQGFAQGISARAEVPISVISEDTDSGRHYRVVLPYNSEAQRLERLAKLESATRLEMGE